MIGASRSVTVRPVDTADRRDVRRFVDLPHRLFAEEPRWAPPGLRRDAIRQLDRERHPFYEHSDAAFFLAERDGRPVGRIAALENRLFNRHHGSRTGFFGHFDSVDDRTVSDPLFEAALGWMRTHRLDSAFGPRGVSGIDGSLLVDGFEHPAVLGVPWTPPHYVDLVRAAGFDVAKRYVSGWFSGDHVYDPRIPRVARRAADRGGYRTKGFTTRRELRRWAPRILPVFLESMRDLETFYPPSARELDETIRTVLTIADPRGIHLVLRDDEVVGFLLSYPDLAPELRRSRGRLLPWGWLRILTARTTRREYAINGLGLLPHHRGGGANALLYMGIFDGLIGSVGISRAEVVQVAADNVRSREDMNALGVTWYKEHHSYQRAI